MSPTFSSRSLAALGTAHPDLRRLFHEVVRHVDCTVLEGHRDHESQEQALVEGRSALAWPKSKHNAFPALAVDVVPYPINWLDTQRMHYFAGFVKGVALGLGIRIRWGGDWDGGTRTDDERLRDLPHFEIIDSQPAP